MRRRLGAIFLAFVMCISMVPAYKSFAAENAIFEVEATIFTKAEATDLKIQEGSGWFADVYDIEESDVVNTKKLPNGINKYTVAFKVSWFRRLFFPERNHQIDHLFPHTGWRKHILALDKFPWLACRLLLYEAYNLYLYQNP